MENKCDFCSRVRNGDGAQRILNGSKYCLCDECAQKLDNLTSRNQIFMDNAMYWFEKNFSYNQNLISQLRSLYMYHLPQPQSLEKTKAFYGWIKIIKNMSVISLICDVISFSVVGLYIWDFVGAILGFLVGIAVGLATTSLMMAFAYMAEDVKVTSEYTKDLSNILYRYTYRK